MWRCDRLVGLLALLLLLLGGRAVAEDEPAAPAPITDEEAVACLRAFVEHRRAGRIEQAWQVYDGAAFARRAFGDRLDELEADTRALVLALVRRGVPHMDTLDPLPWTRAGATLEDFRAQRLADGTTAVTFEWKSKEVRFPGPVRWGFVLVRAGRHLRAVDFPFDQTETPRLGSRVLAEQIDKVLGRDVDLPTALRMYFHLGLPETVVPDDAPVDWASPDVLALDLVPPRVPGAAADGWYGTPAPKDWNWGDALVHRTVVHVLPDARMAYRLDPRRWGDAVPLRPQPLTAVAAQVALIPVKRGYTPLLLRIDRRTPWAVVLRLLQQVSPADRGRVAFSVRRAAADGDSPHGQLGLRPAGEVPVVATRAALRKRGGFERHVVSEPLPGKHVRVRLGARKGVTSVQVGEADARPLPTWAEEAERAAALTDLRREVQEQLKAQGLERVDLEVAPEAAQAVRHGDVVEVLGALRAIEGARAELTIPQPEADPARPAARPQPTWTLPQGWVARPKTAFRPLAAAPAKARQTECYVMTLPGTGGGWKANILRWRAQMGSQVGEEETLKQIERWPVAGVSARVVRIRGTYRGMGAEAPLEDALLVGVICDLPSRTLFVKLLGPRAEVEPELERFKALCASIRVP